MDLDVTVKKMYKNTVFLLTLRIVIFTINIISRTSKRILEERYDFYPESMPLLMPYVFIRRYRSLKVLKNVRFFVHILRGRTNAH